MNQPTTPKRKKTNRACNHCHKAHMTCDAGRPCNRCVLRGLSDTCEDAPRKKKKYLADVSPVVLQRGQPIKEEDSYTVPEPKSIPYQASLLDTSLSAPDMTKEKDAKSLFPSQSTNAYNGSMYKKAEYPNRRRTNFLSSAAGLEYSTLSGILQDNFMHANHSTSNEGTPNSYISPAVSPQAFQMGFVNRNDFNGVSPYVQSPSPANTGIYDTTRHPKCDESINQYFLGPADGDHVSMFPDVITAIETMKQDDPAVFSENRKPALSFTIGIIPEDNYQYAKLVDGETDHFYKEPEEIYERVDKPFSYTPGYHMLIAYLKNRFPKPMLVKMAESMAAYRPSFIACTNSLKEGDLIFMEQCFQRTLLTYDNFIRVSGTPTIVWRRTGEIAYVGNEFCILTGWSKSDLMGGGKKRFIVELLDDKSVVEYFQLFSHIAFGDFLGATMTECTLLTPKGVRIRTGCIWTLKRDVFGIPMMIIGNFLPII